MPLKFNPTFKNPCFYGNESNGLFDDTTLHCLPYFYIIGKSRVCMYYFVISSS